MKKRIITLSLIVVALFSTTAFMVLSSTGMVGYTGAPGEATCANCHSGGSSAAAGVTISAVPDFSLGQYMPDSTYQVNISVGAQGFSRYGFDCVILDSLNNDAGVMKNQGPGVFFTTAFNGRKNATHTSKKIGAAGVNFTFKWQAPSSGKATIYVCANAVNNNNNTSGDMPLPSSLELTAAPLPPVDSSIFVGLGAKPSGLSSGFQLYPNPSFGFSNVTYHLNKGQNVNIDLYDLKGSHVKEVYNGNQAAGPQSQILNFGGTAPGVYFLRLSLEGKTASQKLLMLN